MDRTIVGFRRDLRISDHEPLLRAAGRGLVVPVFVFDRALLHHPETARLGSDGILAGCPPRSRCRSESPRRTVDCAIG